MAFPFRKILCPVDFDPSASAVLELAAKVAATSRAKIYILHVVPLIAPTGMPNYVEVFQREERAVRTKLDELAHQYLWAVDHEVIAYCGDPVQFILGAEKRIPADLVVMGTHGRQGFGRMVLGSVAEAIVRQSDCPVLTVRADAIRVRNHKENKDQEHGHVI